MATHVFKSCPKVVYNDWIVKSTRDVMIGAFQEVEAYFSSE